MKPIRMLSMLALFVAGTLSLAAQTDLSELKLKNFRPRSIYNIEPTEIAQPAYPVIDMHSHDYAASGTEVRQWVRTMDELNIVKVVILTMKTGAAFDSVVNKYAAFPDRFELWCGFDFTGYDSDPDWVSHAVEELERCYKLGARGVGELGDKGEGLLYSKPVPAYGLHINDPEMKPLLEKCAELGMPINIHVAEPYWMYAPMDSTNDGLMNAFTWRIDQSKKGLLGHAELLQTLENAVRENPQTTFIACHFANCSYDLQLIGRMLDTYPNLWVDNSARYGETAPVPRYMNSFYSRYQDRILYGTDMGFDASMYKLTFRILETADEHFYATELFNYHWPCYGFDLPGDVLQKIYRDNANKILKD